MKPKSTSHRSFYPLKVVIGAVVLLIVAIVTTPEVFREKLKNLLGPGD